MIITYVGSTYRNCGFSLTNNGAKAPFPKNSSTYYKGIKMKKIGLLIATLLTFSQAEFTRTESGVVTDSQTGLEWQDAYTDNSIPKDYGDSAISYCTALDLDGIGWRLPNINELKSLLVDTQFAPSIDEVFQLTVNSFYWSSTTTKNNSNYRYTVSFSTGGIDYRQHNNSSYYSYIRCVR